MTTSNFERRLTEALAFEVSGEALTRLDALVANNLAGGRRPMRRNWRIAVVAAVLVIAVPLAAVATAGIRHTEDPFGMTDAAGFQAEIDAAKEVVPLPPGADWPAFLTVSDHNAGYSRKGGRFWVEGVAFCLWMDAWISADDSEDAALAKSARDTLLSVPTWVLYSSPFADQSYRDVLDSALIGVKAGDRAVAREASRPACQ